MDTQDSGDGDPRRGDAEGRDAQGEKAENDQARSGQSPERAPQEKVHITLTRTAQLHEVSKSHLSRQVRAGKPAKDHDLSGYVEIEDGRIKGFWFPPGYEFPGGQTAREVARAAGAPGPPSPPAGESSNVEGSHVEDSHMEDSHEEDSHGEDKDGGPESAAGGPEADGQGAEVWSLTSGWAQSERELYVGEPVWGFLQEVTEDGETQLLRQIPRQSPVTIEDISETYGTGRYRISRPEDGEQIHITFGVSRRSPAEVERRLAKVDSLEQQVEYLTERLQEKIDGEEDLWDEVQELKGELNEERHKRKEAERKLRDLERRHEEEIRREKRRLQDEKRKEVDEALEELREEREELKSKLREKDRELESKLREKGMELESKLRGAKSKHKQEVRELEDEIRETDTQHKIEKIRMEGAHNRELHETKREMEQAADYRVGKFFEMLTQGVENNPEVTRALAWRLLQAGGMEDLAQTFWENWQRQKRSGTEEEQKPGTSAEEAAEPGSTQEEAWDFGQALTALIRASVHEAELVGPPGDEEPTREEMRKRAPLRPEDFPYVVICP